jgi:hypothetical protein
MGESRAGEQVACRQSVLELPSAHPSRAVDDEFAEESIVCRRPAEAGDADPTPRTRDRSERWHVTR